uniref:Aminopeptidase n=1 Tax=Clastoptera arizonana TaxID=38151 RepID=A0A1B6D6B8_9HEMI
MSPNLFFLLLVTLLSAVNASDTPSYRLPGNVIPKHYVLDIITNLDEDNFSFQGNVWIKVKCVVPTDKIYLHYRKLNITSEQVTVKEIMDKNEIKNLSIQEQKMDSENDFYIIKLSETLEENKNYVIYLPFGGILTEGLAGYYRSSYLDRTTNTTKWLAVTQFEANDARQAFPCFDEPAMKATFTISLAHKDIFKSASNMPLVKTEPIVSKPNWVWDRFEDTVPISTYLVAFVVSDFEFRTSDKFDNNVTFRIWAQKDAIDQVEFARQVGPKFLSYYEKYFDVKYPLPKQDMVAIPDFRAGAMENWGLITYRESLLLFDKKTSSTASQHSIASVIAHELAHQWFGNLVTMKWWTDLWLNEGFATYVAGLGVEYAFPEWNSLASNAVDYMLIVFSFDALKTSHPVSVPIGHPTEISQIFDTISYKKGAYLLRMMNSFLGEEVFQQGVSNYLKLHKYSNAEQDDLWKSLTDKAHESGALPKDMSVKEIMDTWTVQTGYPVVTVTRDYNKKTVTLTQNRYLAVKNESIQGCWWVPITYTREREANFNETMPKQWLNCKEREVQMTVHADSDEWVIFNIQSAGLYRVKYDEDNWKKIALTLNSDKFKNIAVLNKVQLLADALDFAWGGEISYELAFNILNYLRNEDEYLPWKSGLSNLNYIDRLVRRTSKFGVFKKYVRNLITPIYEKIGSMKNIAKTFEGVKHQSLIISWACRFEVGDCAKQANSLFNEWRQQEDPDSNNPIPSDLRGIVYCSAVKHGGEEVWEYMWQRYKKAHVVSEKALILSSLACSTDVWILNRFLDWSVDEKSDIRLQDSASVFVSVARTDVGYYIAKNFLYKNIKKIYNFYHSSSNLFGKYIAILAEQMIYEDDRDELKEFGKNNLEYLKSSQLQFHRSIETVVANTRWYNSYYNTIMQMLSSEKPQ